MRRTGSEDTADPGSLTGTAELWDMPMACSATSFNSATGADFAKCVATGTGGGLEIVTHAGGSPISGSGIKRAVQTGQVQIGERLLPAHQNENALFGFDSIPFLATSFEDAAALWVAAKPKPSPNCCSAGTCIFRTPCRGRPRDPTSSRR